MFRRPMRLEKWIAFDGALGVEVLNPDPDVDVNNDVESDNNDAEAYGISLAEESLDNSISFSSGLDDDFSPLFSIMSAEIGWTVESNGRTCNVKVELPDDADAALLPFYDESVKFSTGSSSLRYAQGTDFYLEITSPDDGAFGFVNWSDVKSNQSKFIRDNDLSSGDKVAFAYVEGGRNYIAIRTVNGNSFSSINSSGGRAEFALMDDGGVRLHLVDKGNFTYGNGALKQFLQSLAFYADEGSDPAKVEGFFINVYYLEGAGKSSENLFHDGEGGMFNSSNESVSAISTDPDFVHVNVDNGSGGDDGEDDGGGDDGEDDGGEEEVVDPPEEEDPTPPDPLDPIDEVDPPGPDEPAAPDPDPDPIDPEKPLDPTPSPVDSGGGDGDGDSGGESDSGDNADQSDAGGEAGAEAGDDLVYIYREDGEEEGAEQDADSEDKKEVATVEAEVVEGEARLMETAADAAIMELGRSAEMLLTTVRGEREILLVSLTRLQNEYLLRGATEYAGLRSLLREIFEMGNREKDAVNRIIAQMNRQMEVFRKFTPEQRDGMLIESLRELLDSAERRTGETGAFSQAIDAVTRLLAETRLDGKPVPSSDEVSGLFDGMHAEALSRWLAKAELSDPMGKDLAAAERAMADKAAAAVQ